MHAKELFSLLLISAAFAGTSYAQSHISTQSHQASVTAIDSMQDELGETSVITGALDGFLVKWTEDGMGEHYQITDLPIKMVARSPNGNDVAVYETDGANINRVSIWDWKKLNRKYSFRFTDSLTAMKFSAKGSYLICGTASVSGTVFINAKTGQVVSRKLRTATGLTNLIFTSKTENSAVFYSPTTGSLTYYNLKNGSQKGKFQTEYNLTQTTLFNNGLFMAGIKNKQLFIIYAMNGQTIASYNVGDTVLLNSEAYPDLFYLTVDNRVISLFKIQNDRNKNVIAPVLVKTFSRLKMNETLQCATLCEGTIYAGTSSGDVYKFDMSEVQLAETLSPLTDNMYDHIYDVANAGNDFYFLTPNALFRSSFDNGVVDKKGENPGHTNMIPYGDNVILWSKDSKKNVELLDIASGSRTVLFTPTNTIQTLRLSGSFLIDIEGNSTVNRYDLEAKKREELYQGSGLQDAILLSQNDLYVAKSAATNPQVPLLYVNCETKETVPLGLKGAVAYGLTFDATTDSDTIYGIVVGENQSHKIQTSLFSWDTQSKSSHTYLPLSDDDNNAFTYLSDKTIYTNMGKNQVRSYSLSNRREFTYKRSASMPLKVCKNADRLVVLNRDGSISWYNPTLSGVLADWYLTTDGQWFEF